MERERNIVIFDFDDTWSIDRLLFIQIRRLLQSAGFKAILCTARSKSDPTNVQIYQDWEKEDVFFTEGYQKRPYLEKVGFPMSQIAFFIDDNPESIPEIFGQVVEPE